MNLLRKIDQDVSDTGQVSQSTIELARSMLDQNLQIAPAIGAEFIGGRYAGIIRDAKTDASYHLFYADSYHECFDISWHRALRLFDDGVDGGIGWVLPTRLEFYILGINVPDSFDLDELYWTSSKSATTPNCAWAHRFLDGKQICISKNAKCRARAIRRVPIHTALEVTS